MCRCNLCGPISHNEADFSLSVGREDRELKVCRWCEEDFELLGIEPNQIVRLPRPQRLRRIRKNLIVLGPVYTLLGSFPVAGG
jgi:hypothetical protein